MHRRRQRTRQALLLRKMRSITALSACLAFLLATCADGQAVNAQQTADIVCSQQGGCIQGSVSAKAGAILTLPASTANSTTTGSRALLLPGTYAPALAASGGSSGSANFSLLSPFLTSSTSTAQPGFSLSASSGSGSISIVPSSGLTIYSSALYSGPDVSFLPYNDSYTRNATSSFTPISVTVSQDVNAVAKVPVRGGQQRRITIWASSPDVSEWPVQLQNGKWEIEDLQGDACSPSCASGGLCSLDGQCLCAPGFTGTTCDQCQPGCFGSQCTTCPDCPNGTCEEGITGTGRCVPSPTIPAASACQCTNGVCGTSNSSCICNPGWADAIGGNRCSICATGFYLDSSSGDCLSCGAGCTSCASGTGTCSTCQPGLQVSSDNPSTCIGQRFLPVNGTAFTSCQSGFYLSDATTGTCSACSGACGECFGPGQGDCLACPSGRGLLQGTCVSVDAGTGICDGSALSAGTALAWLYNNQNKVCDPLPAGCTAGSINAFSAASTRAQAQCTACLAGMSLHAGQCVESCPSGFFSTGGTSSTCQACTSGCLTCEGSADFCTTCPTGSLVVNGSCQAVSTCPAGTFQTNSTAACTSCHPDCATCSGTFDTCTSCASSRPALISGSKCASTCSSMQYLDEDAGSCRSCDASCGSCAGAGNGQCLSCSGNTVLKAGVCVSADCAVSVTGLGVCLKDLAQLSKSRTSLDDSGEGKKLPAWVFVLIGLGVLFLLALLVMGWRIRAVKKRMAKTAGFTRRKGLAGFIDLFRWQKKAKSTAASKDFETAANDKTLVFHNQIELQHSLTGTRSPIPPPYDYSHTPPHPAFFKQQYMFPPSLSSASVYSHDQGDYRSTYGHRQIWPAEKGQHDRMPSPIHWPPPSLSRHDSSHSGSTSVSEGNHLRPLMLRGSSSTASSSLKPTAERRYGSLGMARDFEDSERQKTLDLLTGQDSRGSGSRRIESGLL